MILSPIKGRYKYKTYPFCLYFLLFCLAIGWFYPQNLTWAATEQTTNLWTSVNASGDVLNLSKLEYSLETQSRFVITPNEWELEQINFGLGYQDTPDVSFWLGYQWHSKNLFSDSNETNYIWQQISWQIYQNKCLTFSSRTRLEERYREGESETSYHLRQKLELDFPKMLCQKLTPVLYDEIFFNLNNPTWVASSAVSQNRLFIGVNIPQTKKTFWEIGYMNRFTKGDDDNHISHIAFISFNIET